MRSKLQYVYSISILTGVFITAYLMMSSELTSRFPLRAVQVPATSTFRMDASSVDPAVDKLFEMEEAFARLKRDRNEPKSRKPSDADVLPLPAIPRPE